jgi:hypothetical protein
MSTESSGRSIPDPGFAGDLGDADARLTATLAAHAEGTASPTEVLAALAGARVLVPVVAVLGEEADVAPGELRREKSADMALPTLVGADGRRALPVFTSLAAMAAWQPDARPVPVEIARAALSAVAEGCSVLVVDVAGPATFVAARPQLRALAEGRAWLPPYDDPDVGAVVARAVEDEADVAEASVGPGAADGPELMVTLAVRTGAPAGEVARRVAERLAGDETIRTRTSRGVGIGVRPAD